MQSVGLEHQNMKLHGLRVVDFSMFLPGPHLTMMLADHGADVIRIEPPGEGEPVRHIGLRQGGQSIWFRNTHRGKRSVVVDLKDTAQRSALVALIDDADVLLEAFRPGVMARLGLDYDTLSARNPGLVYASIAAFGQTGPLRDKPAHDLAIEAMAGTLSLNLGVDAAPVNPAMPCADLAASLMALSGILMALLRRANTGQGDYLDLSMQDALMAWMPNIMGPLFAEQRAPVIQHERSWGGNAFYRSYRTGDGQHVTLGGSELKFVRNLLYALTGPEQAAELAALCSAGPGPQQQPVVDFLSAQFACRSLLECEALLAALDVCWAPVLDLAQAWAHPQIAAREMLLRDDADRLHLGVPIKFRHEPARPNLQVPELDSGQLQWQSSLSIDRSKGKLGGDPG